MKWAIKVAYDGTNFYGSQIQKDRRTVEGEVRRALKKCGFFGSELFFASRTDRYASALANVFSYSGRKPILGQLNDLLPEDVVAWGYCEVPQEFNPRFAVEKHYRYFLPLKNNDPEKMRRAITYFQGERSFHNFSADREKHPVLIIDRISMGEKGGTIILDFYAMNFLWMMIRKIVTAVSKVSSGEWNFTMLKQLLEPGFDFGLEPAPAEGLLLVDIDYGFGFTEEKQWLLKKFGPGADSLLARSAVLRALAGF